MAIAALVGAAGLLIGWFAGTSMSAGPSLWIIGLLIAAGVVLGVVAVFLIKKLLPNVAVWWALAPVLTGILLAAVAC